MIKPSKATRYLGVIIDSQLKWIDHMQHIERNVAPRIGLLRFLSSAAEDSNDKIMLNLYKSLVRTILVYGHAVILTAGDKIWKRLQVLQNKAIRATLNLPHYTSTRYIHQISQLPKIKDYALSLLQNSLNTAINNNNSVLRDNLEYIQYRIT